MEQDTKRNKVDLSREALAQKAFKDLVEIDLFRKAASIPLELKDCPFTELICDLPPVKQTFADFKIIPYAQTSITSNHNLCLWLNALPILSPTLGSTINRICKFAFGGAIEINNNPNNCFDVDGATEVSNTDKLAFINNLQNLDFGTNTDIKKFSKAIYKNHLAKNGNLFIEVIHTDILDNKKVSFKIHNTYNTTYIDFPINGVDSFLVTKRYDDSYIRDYGRVLPKYPFFKEEKGGQVRRSMIHYKLDDAKYYSKPEWYNCVSDVFREYSKGKELRVAGANNFLAQVLLEVECNTENPLIDNDAAVQDGFDSFIDQFNKSFTAKAGDNLNRAIVMSRPVGARPAFVHEFKLNTDTAYHKWETESLKNKILQAMQWSCKLNGENSSNGFSQRAFMEELLVYELSTLKDVRENVEYVINDLVKVGFKELGINDTYNMKFTSPYKDILSTLNNSNTETQEPLNE